MLIIILTIIIVCLLLFQKPILCKYNLCNKFTLPRVHKFLCNGRLANECIHTAFYLSLFSRFRPLLWFHPLFKVSSTIHGFIHFSRFHPLFHGNFIHFSWKFHPLFKVSSTFQEFIHFSWFHPLLMEISSTFHGNFIHFLRFHPLFKNSSTFHGFIHFSRFHPLFMVSSTFYGFIHFSRFHPLFKVSSTPSIFHAFLI